MIDRRKFSLLLTMLLNTPLAIGASDCSSLISTDKDSFLNQLKGGDAGSIYTELHDCVQNNFCASYNGSAACLPTLNNYTAYAAYYNSAGKSSDGSSVIIIPAAAPEQPKQTQQSPQSSEVYQPPPPPTTDSSSNTGAPTDSSDKDSTSSGGLYEGINF